MYTSVFVSHPFMQIILTLKNNMRDIGIYLLAHTAKPLKLMFY
jgi:hypothetical protein